MNNVILFVVIIGLTFKGFTQEKVKTIKTETEKYAVLKSDRTIKHGNYEKYGWSKSVILKGQYDHGKKIGV